MTNEQDSVMADILTMTDTELNRMLAMAIAALVMGTYEYDPEKHRACRELMRAMQDELSHRAELT